MRNGLNMCVPFSFNLDILPEGVFNGPGGRGARLETQKSDTEARLVAIEPATAQNLDVQQPLRLVYRYYIRWRLKLEGETENMNVCTKERKGVTAEVLMATRPKRSEHAP